MENRQRGFTLVELMIVVLVIGILAAIAIPNLISMQARAKEGSLKNNMHTFQMTAEDYGIQNDGRYADLADSVAAQIMVAGSGFRNPFTQSAVAWEDRTGYSNPSGSVPGVTSYADTLNTSYNIKGHGRTAPLNLVLSSGQ